MALITSSSPRSCIATGNVIILCILVFLIFNDTPFHEDTSILVPVSRISESQAIALAINNLESTEERYRLRHPRHTATFTSDGMKFTPRRGGPDWHWRLNTVILAFSPLHRTKCHASHKVWLEH